MGPMADMGMLDFDFQKANSTSAHDAFYYPHMPTSASVSAHYMGMPDSSNWEEELSAAFLAVTDLDKGAVEDVPDVYDCPSPVAFNSICARLGNLPQIELNALEWGVVRYATIGFVLLPGGLCLLALGVIALRAQSDENQGSASIVR